MGRVRLPLSVAVFGVALVAGVSVVAVVAAGSTSGVDVPAVEPSATSAVTPAPGSGLPLSGDGDRPIALAARVVAVDTDAMVFHHDAPAASAVFDTGILVVDVAAGDDTLRWLPVLGDVVDGGRISRAEAATVALPAGLFAVVSFDRGGERVSVVGMLSASPVFDAEGVRYTMTIVDAPGRSSTYSTAGDYDIPAELVSVGVTVVSVV